MQTCTPNDSTLIKRIDYLDALRGYAILMVIAVHVSQAFLNLPDWLAKILAQGARGVQLFFVISALTLCMSWVARNENAVDFYIRRVFRIAPMFWIAILLFLWLDGTGPSTYAPEGIGVRHVVMTALLVHGFYPDTITSVVPGGWSVADEVIFYVLFPVIVPPLLNTSLRSLIIVTVAAAVLGAQVSRLLENFSYLLPSAAEAVAGEFFFLWFPRQLPCFIFGVMLFRFSTEPYSLSIRQAKLICALALALILTLPFLVGIRYALPLGLTTTYGIAFSLLALSLMHWPSSPLVGSVVVWIGKISYSAYFVHFAVLHSLPALHFIGWTTGDLAATYAVITAITVGISSITYLLVEKSATRLGSAIVAKRHLRRCRELGIRSETAI